MLKVESTVCFQRKRRRERAVTRELFAKFGTKSGNRQRYKRLTAETNVTNSERKKPELNALAFANRKLINAARLTRMRADQVFLAIYQWPALCIARMQRVSAVAIHPPRNR